MDMLARASVATEEIFNQKTATCTDAATVVNKTATSPNFRLRIGETLYCWFQYGNTAANPTLNVNGTGAFPIGDAAAWGLIAQCIRVGQHCLFQFSGTHWILEAVHGILKTDSPTYSVIGPTGGSTIVLYMQYDLIQNMYGIRFHQTEVRGNCNCNCCGSGG